MPVSVNMPIWWLLCITEDFRHLETTSYKLYIWEEHRFSLKSKETSKRPIISLSGLETCWLAQNEFWSSGHLLFHYIIIILHSLLSVYTIHIKSYHEIIYISLYNTAHLHRYWLYVIQPRRNKSYDMSYTASVPINVPMGPPEGGADSLSRISEISAAVMKGWSCRTPITYHHIMFVYRYTCGGKWRHIS